MPVGGINWDELLRALEQQESAKEDADAVIRRDGVPEMLGYNVTRTRQTPQGPKRSNVNIRFLYQNGAARRGFQAANLAGECTGCAALVPEGDFHRCGTCRAYFCSTCTETIEEQVYCKKDGQDVKSKLKRKAILKFFFGYFMLPGPPPQPPIAEAP